MLRNLLAVAVASVIISTASNAMAAHASIAFSQSTGNYGYAVGYHHQGNADSAALARCSGDGAQVVVTAQNAWCALAVGDGNAFGWAWSTSQAEAKHLALQRCAHRAANAHIVVSAFSGSN